MTYSKVSLSSGAVVPNSLMNQISDNIQDHVHGVSSVTPPIELGTYMYKTSDQSLGNLSLDYFTVQASYYNHQDQTTTAGIFYPQSGGLYFVSISVGWKGLDSDNTCALQDWGTRGRVQHQEKIQGPTTTETMMHVRLSPYFPGDLVVPYQAYGGAGASNPVISSDDEYTWWQTLLIHSL